MSVTFAEGIEPALRQAVIDAGLDTVDGAFAYGGGDDLVKPGLGHRRRTKLCLLGGGGQVFELYLKRYERVPLGKRLRRWQTYGRRGLAQIEFENIAAVHLAGIATMQAVCFGHQGHRGYLIVTSVPGESLERCGEAFLEKRADAPRKVAVLTEKLSLLAATLHKAGLAHRDFYACHVFLDETADGLMLYLIDLARIFRPRWRHLRWRVKDLAQLKYSMPTIWVEQEWTKFLADYVARAGGNTSRLIRAIDRKVAAMRRRQQRKKARKI